VQPVIFATRALGSAELNNLTPAEVEADYRHRSQPDAA
jgi:hypothetical protein